VRAKNLTGSLHKYTINIILWFLQKFNELKKHFNWTYIQKQYEYNTRKLIMYLPQLKAKLAYVSKMWWKSTSYRISFLIFLASSLFTIKFIISVFINTRLTYYLSRIIRINSECVNIYVYTYLFPIQPSKQNNYIIVIYRVGKVLIIVYICV